MTETEQQNKIAETGAVAEEKARNTIENLEESRLGKKLPTQLHDVQLKEIVMFILFSSTVNFLPCYIIYGREFGNKMDWIRSILFLCFIIFSVSTFMFTVIGFSTNTTGFFRYCLFSVIGKAVFSFILIFMSNVRQSFHKFILALIYYCYIDIVDFFLLYYLALYFKRIESEEYDENGQPIIKKKEEEVQNDNKN